MDLIYSTPEGGTQVDRIVEYRADGGVEVVLVDGMRLICSKKELIIS